MRAGNNLNSVDRTRTLVGDGPIADARSGGPDLRTERWGLDFVGRGYNFDVKFRIDGKTESPETLSARSLLAVVRPSFGIVLGGRCIFASPFRPIPCTLGPRIGDSRKKVM